MGARSIVDQSEFVIRARHGRGVTRTPSARRGCVDASRRQWKAEVGLSRCFRPWHVRPIAANEKTKWLRPGTRTVFQKFHCRRNAGMVMECIVSESVESVIGRVLVVGNFPKG